MRRPVTILAGLLLAAGSSFAMALPASAALSHGTQSSVASHNPYDWYDDDDSSYYFDGDDEFNDDSNRNRNFNDLDQDQDQDLRFDITNNATATNTTRGDDNDTTDKNCLISIAGIVCV
jgi:hypothetical protein